MKKQFLFVIITLLVLFGNRAAYGMVFFVDDNAPPDGNGQSWQTAYKYLQDAMAAASGGDQIRVAGGIYKPDQGDGIMPGDRKATFQL